MSAITNKWNDGSEDSITIESSSFIGNQTISISSPVQIATVKRSIALIGKCVNDASKTVTLTVEQLASAYTYEFSLAASNTTLAAGGGEANITATLKTFRNGGLVNTESVTPVLSGEAEGFTISGTKVTAANRAKVVGVDRSITVTGTFSGTFDKQTVKATIVIKQAANAITYAAPVVKLAYDDIPASGGSVTPKTATATQGLTYTSGATDNISVTSLVYSGTGVDTKTGSVSAATRGTTVGERKSITEVTLTATANSKSGTAKVTVYQQANAATSITYGVPTVNLTVGDIPAKGGEIASGTVTYSQTATQNYTSGATSALSAITTGGTVTYSTKVTAASLGTIEKVRTKVGTLTATVALNSKSGSKTVDVYQQANAATYGDLVGGSATTSLIPASGGTSTITVTNATQTVSFTSGSTRAGTVTNSKTADVKANSLGTIIKAQTKVGTVTVTFTGEGSKTKSISVDVNQAENKVTDANHNTRITAYGTPTINISDGLTAAGGSATVTHGVNNTQTYNALYSSGATGADQTRSVAGTTTIAITTNGNNRFTLSGNKITHTSMGTNAVTDTVTITAKNSGDTTKTATASKSITNAITSTTYGDITINYSYPVVPASGAAVSPTVTYSQTSTKNYTSGSTAAGSNVTSGATITYARTTDTNGLVIGTDGKASGPSRGTTVGDSRTLGTATVTVKLNNKTGTKVATVTQAANAITSTTYVNITIGTYSYGVAPASGATVSPNVAYSQIPTQHFTSGSTKALTAVTTGATLKYSKVSGDLITVNTTSGAVNGPNRTTTVGEARSIGVARVTVTLNGKTTTKDVSVTQQANERSVSGTTGGVTTYGDIKAGTITNATIPASGGTKTATAGKGSQSWNKSAVTTNYKYTSGSTSSTETTAASSGTNDVNPSVASIEATAPSLGTTVKEQTTIKSQAVTWTANGKSASGTMYIYQEANAIKSYNYGTWTITISASPTTISRDGGTSEITANCTRSKTPVYTSGATGTAGSESATPTLTCSGTGFSLEGTTVTATKNTGGARSCTVTAAYSGATSETCTINQEAGLDGIGYMQIEGDGVSHPIFRVG